MKKWYYIAYLLWWPWVSVSLRVISLLQDFSSAIFRTCGMSRDPSASVKLLIVIFIANQKRKPNLRVHKKKKLWEWICVFISAMRYSTRSWLCDFVTHCATKMRDKFSCGIVVSVRHSTQAGYMPCKRGISRKMLFSDRICSSRFHQCDTQMVSHVSLLHRPMCVAQ